MIKPPRLIPASEWQQHHSWPPNGGLRHLIFHAKTNGFQAVIRRVGRRVLIDEAAFFAWVEENGGSKVNRPSPPRPSYSDAADILREAHFTEDPKRMRLDKLPEAALLELIEAKLMGFMPTRCSWPDGMSVLMLIPPGEQFPAPKLVVDAYRMAALQACPKERGNHAG